MIKLFDQVYGMIEGSDDIASGHYFLHMNLYRVVCAECVLFRESVFSFFSVLSRKSAGFCASEAGSVNRVYEQRNVSKNSTEI